MFICEECIKTWIDLTLIPKKDQWTLDMALISRGPCEICGHVGNCIDYHGKLTGEVREKAEDKSDKERQPDIEDDMIDILIS